MGNTVIRFDPDGRMLVVLGDSTSALPFMTLGCGTPTRASRVEPVAAGPFAGYFHVDMSPMGADWEYCLWPPRETRAEALSEEHKHLVDRWLLGGDDTPDGLGRPNQKD